MRAPSKVARVGRSYPRIPALPVQDGGRNPARAARYAIAALIVAVSLALGAAGWLLAL